tara:strand:+ start:421 stop:1665 length:1245 start_codon:yes stop_codon:yes gene_type:complete
MNNNLIKIFCFFIFFGSSFSTLSQDKIKDGESRGRLISISVSDTIISSSDSRFVVTFDTISIISSDSIFSELKDTLCISVLLPFYLDENTNLDNEQRNKGKSINKIYSKSSYALSFLEGIVFAIDSLSKLDIPIKLNVFDTRNNPAVVRNIARKKVVKESNILFGPLYPDNFKIISNFYRLDKNKIIINPLSTHYDLLKKKKNVYFLTPSLQQQSDLICFFLKKLDKSIPVSLIKFSEEKKNITYHIDKHELDTVFENFRIKEFKSYSKINKQSFSFLDVENNLLLLWSDEESFINRFVSFLGTVNNPVSLFTFKSCDEFDRIDIETLMKLDIHVPVSNYFDNYSKKNRNLQNKFERVFYHKMNKNSRLSFYSILHFCSNQKQYNFTQLYENGGFINTDVQICTYKDYRLTPIE